MIERNDSRRSSEEVDKNAPAMSLAESSAKILSQQTAALAMMTAYGVSLTSRMTGMFFGAMADAMEKRAEKPPVSKAGEPMSAPVKKTEPKAKAEAKAELKTRSEPRATKPQAKSKVQPASKREPKVKSEVVNLEAVRSKKATKQSGQDNLKLIPGIGPKLEQALNSVGISTLAQIADWKPADIKKIDSDFGLENRIIRDDWVGQARRILQEGK